MGEFIHHIEHSVFAAIMGTVLDEVVRPDVIGYAGRRRIHDPSVSHSRPRLGCLAGTFSPSRLQTGSTRPSLTDQPAWRSRPAILR